MKNNNEDIIGCLTPLILFIVASSFLGVSALLSVDISALTESTPPCIPDVYSR